MDDLGAIPKVRRTGREDFRIGNQSLDFCLQEFWQWSASDIISNATRGLVAEFLVANAIGAAYDVRDEWAAYDLNDPRGFTIEVKSAAYIQSWKQRRLSPITFNCKRSFAVDPDTGKQEAERRRQAEVYVFALLAHQVQSTLDPFDLRQWEFYVVPTVTLDRRTRSQHSITLNSLQALHGSAVSFHCLGDAIAHAAHKHRAETSG